MTRSISMDDLARIAADASDRARTEALDAGLDVPVWENGLVISRKVSSDPIPQPTALMPARLPAAAEEIAALPGLDLRVLKGA